MAGQYTLIYSEEAFLVLSKLDKESRTRLIKRMEKLQEHPERLIYPLTGTDLFSMRAGEYRVLLTLEKTHMRVYIATIGHRKNIYDKRT